MTVVRVCRATRKIGRIVVTAQVPAEDGLVGRNVALVETSLATGEPAVERYVIQELEGGRAIARRLPAALVGMIGSIRYPSIPGTYGCVGQGILIF